MKQTNSNLSAWIVVAVRDATGEVVTVMVTAYGAADAMRVMAQSYVEKAALEMSVVCAIPAGRLENGLIKKIKFPGKNVKGKPVVVDVAALAWDEEGNWRS
jgi:hypothetical protein